jgi:hypothetical protein
MQSFPQRLEALWEWLVMSLVVASSRATYGLELGCFGWSNSASSRRTRAAMRWRWGRTPIPATIPNTNQKMASIPSSSPDQAAGPSCNDILSQDPSRIGFARRAI